MIGTNQKAGLLSLATLSRIGSGVGHQDAVSLFFALTSLLYLPLGVE